VTISDVTGNVSYHIWPPVGTGDIFIGSFTATVARGQNIIIERENSFTKRSILGNITVIPVIEMSLDLLIFRKGDFPRSLSA